MVSKREIDSTSERFEEMIQRYQENVSTKKLAEEFGVSKSTVLRRLREYGCKIRHSRKKGVNFSDQEIEKMVEKYQQGAITSELAEEFGVCIDTIIDRLRRANCKVRSGGPRVVRNIPRPWDDADAAYIFGVLIGDASIQYHSGESREEKAPFGIALNTGDEEFKKAYCEAMEDAFGIRVNTYAHSEGYSKLVAHSVDLAKLYNKFKWRTENWCIPKPFFDAPKRIKIALCQGKFDSDGCANRGAIEIVSVHRSGLEDLQRVVKSLGYQTTLNGPYKERRKNRQDTFKLRVSNASFELVRLPRKKKKLK